MIFKRRSVMAVRDFPEGCGVYSGQKSNVGDSLIQPKFKKRSVQARREFPNISTVQDVSTNLLETGKSETAKEEPFLESNVGVKDRQAEGESEDNLRDVAKDELVLESNVGVKDHQEKEAEGENEDNSRDVAKDELVLESIGVVDKDHQEKEVIGGGEGGLERSTKAKERRRPEKKRRLSLHDSTMEAQADVASTSKRSIVLGLAAASKCPQWRKPRRRKDEIQRQVKRLR